MKFDCSAFPVREKEKLCTCPPLVIGKLTIPDAAPADVGEKLMAICTVSPEPIGALPPLTRLNAEPETVTLPRFEVLFVLLPTDRVMVLVALTAVAAASICPLGLIAIRADVGEER